MRCAGSAKSVYIYDVSIPNAYHGIDLGAVRCDGAQVVGLWGTMFHYGVRVGAGSDRVQLENINIDVGPLDSDCRFAAQAPAVANRRDDPARLSRRACRHFSLRRLHAADDFPSGRLCPASVPGVR